MTKLILIFIGIFIYSEICHCSNKNEEEIIKALFLLQENVHLYNNPIIKEEFYKISMEINKQQNNKLSLKNHFTEVIYLNREKVDLDQKIRVNFQKEINCYKYNQQKQYESSIDCNFFKKAGKCTLTESVKDPLKDERKLIENPVNTFPCQVCGKLKIKFPLGTIEATGFLVGPHHVLTAGHNLYDERYGGAAEKIYFYYPCNSSIEEWQEIQGSYAFTVSGWMKKGKDDCDYGMVILEKKTDIPYFIGLLVKEKSDLKNSYINTMGFPTNRQNSHCMYASWGVMTKIKENDIIKHTADTDEGQSGSLIWSLNNSQPYGVGIHTQGFDPNEKSEKGKVNQAIRISHIHLQNIINWIESADQNVKME